MHLHCGLLSRRCFGSHVSIFHHPSQHSCMHRYLPRHNDPRQSTQVRLFYVGFTKERKQFGELIDLLVSKYVISQDDIYRNVVNRDDCRANTEVVNLLNKGNGLISLQDIAEGALIVSEHPLVVLLKGENGKCESMTQHFHRMNLQDKTSYVGMADSYRTLTGGKTTLEGIRASNASEMTLQLQHNTIDNIDRVDPVSTSNAGIYLVCHRINHSCLPNAIFSYSPSSGIGRVFAIRDISKGQEISISYFKGELLNSSERKVYLSNYGITACSCPLCRQSDDDLRQSDARIASIKQLQSEVSESIECLSNSRATTIKTAAATRDDDVSRLESEMRMMSTGLEKVLRLIQLLKEEKIDTADHMNWIHLFQYWLTLDVVYICKSYFYSVAYRGSNNTRKMWQLIPEETRRQGLPLHCLGGQPSCFAEFDRFPIDCINRNFHRKCLSCGCDDIHDELEDLHCCTGACNG